MISPISSMILPELCRCGWMSVGDCRHPLPPRRHTRLRCYSTWGLKALEPQPSLLIDKIGTSPEFWSSSLLSSLLSQKTLSASPEGSDMACIELKCSLDRSPEDQLQRIIPTLNIHYIHTIPSLISTCEYHIPYCSSQASEEQVTPQEFQKPESPAWSHLPHCQRFEIP